MKETICTTCTHYDDPICSLYDKIIIACETCTHYEDNTCSLHDKLTLACATCDDHKERSRIKWYDKKYLLPLEYELTDIRKQWKKKIEDNYENHYITEVGVLIDILIEMSKNMDTGGV